MARDVSKICIGVNDKRYERKKGKDRKERREKHYTSTGFG